MAGQHPQARESAASAAQYVLLGGFAAVAAGISAQEPPGTSASATRPGASTSSGQCSAPMTSQLGLGRVPSAASAGPSAVHRAR